MNTSLLSAIQTEPWSLVLLGAVLFALSSIARRKSPTAVAAVKAADAAAVARGRETAGVVIPRTVDRGDGSSRQGLRPMLGSGLNTAA